MEPLVIPAPAEIEYISVERLKPDGDRQSELKIWDRPKIEAILTELRLDNTSYSSERDGRAPQEYAIALNGKEGMKTMVWVGHGCSEAWTKNTRTRRAGWRATIASSHRSSTGGS